MYSASVRNTIHRSYRLPSAGQSSAIVASSWRPLRQQILLQWGRLSAGEVDKAGPDRHRLALLIERKYGITSDMVENYLRNFERTLPLAMQ